MSEVSTDSTLFDLDQMLYEAKLSRLSGVGMKLVRGKSDGPTVWDRTGSLRFILSELYGSPVELENNPYLRNIYKLEVAWSEEISFDSIRVDLAQAVQNTFGYSIETTTQTRTEYTLSVDDPSRLQSASDTDFVGKGTLTKVSIEGGIWKIYAKLDKFAEILQDKTGRMVVTHQVQDSTAYYFKLNDASDFENLIDQLQSNYGLAVSSQPAEVEYHSIHFSAGG